MHHLSRREPKQIKHSNRWLHHMFDSIWTKYLIDQNLEDRKICPICGYVGRFEIPESGKSAAATICPNADPAKGTDCTGCTSSRRTSSSRRTASSRSIRTSPSNRRSKNTLAYSTDQSASGISKTSKTKVSTSSWPTTSSTAWMTWKPA